MKQACLEYKKWAYRYMHKKNVESKVDYQGRVALKNLSKSKGIERDICNLKILNNQVIYNTWTSSIIFFIIHFIFYFLCQMKKKFASANSILLFWGIIFLAFKKKRRWFQAKLAKIKFDLFFKIFFNHLCKPSKCYQGNLDCT